MAMPSVPVTGPAASAVAKGSPAGTGAAAVGPPGEAKALPTEAEIARAAADLERVIRPVARDLQFTLDRETGKTIVRVIDSQTRQVIRQIPSEELLAIARALSRLQGLLVREQA